jgi:hypothetical protein
LQTTFSCSAASHADNPISYIATVMTSWFAIDLDLNCKQTKEKT